MEALQWLQNADKALFTTINHDWAITWLDPLMLLLREATTWIPLYLFIAFYTWRKNPRLFWWFLLMSVVTFGITDFTTGTLLKPHIGRLRPCADPQMQGIIRSLIPCGGLYSMPSSHAANHFGLAMFWYSVLRRAYGIRWRWLWFWAFAIVYAQVYVGKHFPLDILAGAVTGMLAGWLTTFIFMRGIRKWPRLQTPATGTQQGV
ncbi:phosphatase PAP2 family protein [Deminuibacter soli]|uniref:Phosphatase PAP2 family protein n=1 Tax=Deminuibacter soli TaxID=2291815 RepID=A0A3E1NF42_9BACT|nr:phosphatase PAP2 family protein [Deminuibacter soli]RFM26605.1 phosphatase PAP2 family protein [Deminuibacter soli]